MLVLLAIAAAEPLPSPIPGRVPDYGHTSGLPIADGPRELSTAVKRRTLEVAAHEAVAQLALTTLPPGAYGLRIEVEDGDEELGPPVGDALVRRLGAVGVTVARGVPDRLVARVSSTGVVRSLEARTLEVKERTGWTWGLGSVGGSLLTMGALVYAVSGGADNDAAPGLPEGMMAVGGGMVAVGAGLAFRPPREMEVRCNVFDASVGVALTVEPASPPPEGGPGAAPVSASGTARVPEADAPCSGNMKRLKRQM